MSQTGQGCRKVLGDGTLIQILHASKSKLTDLHVAVS